MDILSDLRKIIPPHNVLDAEKASERSSGIWTGNQSLNVLGIVMPTSTKEVSEVMAHCNKLGQTVIPMGGYTNLTFALKAQPTDLLLSLEKMNKIEEQKGCDKNCRIIDGFTAAHAVNGFADSFVRYQGF